jgi:hypothetical protein
MQQQAWSATRDRQYTHIKASYQRRGLSEGEAQERAVRTVNTTHARYDETKRLRARR